jgi:hypothetical protein
MAGWGAAFTSAGGRSRNLLRENQEVRPPDKLPTQLPTQSRIFGT